MTKRVIHNPTTFLQYLQSIWVNFKWNSLSLHKSKWRNSCTYIVAPRSLVSNTISGVQNFQITKKLRLFYWSMFCQPIKFGRPKFEFFNPNGPDQDPTPQIEFQRLYYYFNRQIWYYGYKYNSWGCRKYMEVP